MNKEKTIEKLNDLVTRNYDSEEGYKQSAEKVENAELKSFLKERAQDRYDFGHELKDEIKAQGGEVDKGTSVAGDIHRVWIGLKDALTSGDKAIYDECVRGEKAFATEYEDALNDEDIPESLHPKLKKQMDNAKEAIKKLDSMGDFK